MQKGPWKVFKPYKQALGLRKGKTGKGRPCSGKGGRRWRGPRGQGASGARGAPTGWLGWNAGWPEELVGDGQNAAAGVNGDGGAPVKD